MNSFSRKDQDAKYTQYTDNVLWREKDQDPVGNAYYGSDFYKSSVQATASGSVVGGVTQGDYVYMNRGDDGSDFAGNTDLVGHEFGHTLGLEDPPKSNSLADQKPYHSTGGIMEYTTTGQQYRINKDDVTKVLKYATDFLLYQKLKASINGMPTSNHFEGRANVGMVTTIENVVTAASAAIIYVQH